MGRYTPDPKVFGIPLFEQYVKSTPEFETMAPSTNGDVLLQYLSAAFLLGERVAESVPSRVIYVDTKEGATPCVVLASNKDHAASFGTEEGRETLKKVYVNPRSECTLLILSQSPLRVFDDNCYIEHIAIGTSLAVLLLLVLYESILRDVHG
ncbi:hypothetical protein EV368DRAFT_88833 [Lentinula lateritia]|nr:hypothetical protein EV368DRAFT_88833 [Lentinula lateritia]